MRSGHDYSEAGNKSIVLVWFNDNNTQKQTYKLKKNEYILFGLYILKIMRISFQSQFTFKLSSSTFKSTWTRSPENTLRPVIGSIYVQSDSDSIVFERIPVKLLESLHWRWWVQLAWSIEPKQLHFLEVCHVEKTLKSPLSWSGKLFSKHFYYTELVLLVTWWESCRGAK